MKENYEKKEEEIYMREKDLVKAGVAADANEAVKNAVNEDVKGDVKMDVKENAKTDVSKDSQEEELREDKTIKPIFLVDIDDENSFRDLKPINVLIDDLNFENEDDEEFVADESDDKSDAIGLEEKEFEDSDAEFLFGEDIEPDSPKLNLGLDKDEFDEMIARIDRRIKELEEEEDKIKSEELARKDVLSSELQEVLDMDGLKYRLESGESDHVFLKFSAYNKPFDVVLIVGDDKVQMKLIFPFRVQTNAMALMSIYMHQLNERRAYAKFELDFDEGELTLEYTYPAVPESFDPDCFRLFMASLLQPAYEYYTKLNHLAIGNVSSEDRPLFKALIKQSMQLLSGKEWDYKDIQYGCENLDLSEYEEDDFSQESCGSGSIEFESNRTSKLSRRLSELERYLDEEDAGEEDGDDEIDWI